MTEPMGQIPSRVPSITALVAIGLVALVALDLTVPPQYAIPVLYLLPLSLTWWMPGSRSTLLVSVFILALTWGALFVSPDGNAELVILRRAMFSVSFLLVTVLLLFLKRSLTERTRTLAQTQQVLDRTERQYQILAKNVPSLFSYVDRTYRYRFVSNQYETTYYRSAETIVGLSVGELLGQANFEDRLKPQLDRAFAGVTFSFETRLVLPDGRVKWMSVKYVPDGDEDGQVQGVFVLANDISALKETEQQLRDQSTKIQARFERLLALHETERQRLAQDLLDEMVRRPVTLAGTLHALSNNVAEETARCLAPLGVELAALENDLRRVSRRLYPLELEKRGLEVALQELLAEYEMALGIPIAFEYTSVPSDLRGPQSLCLYRIVESALHNIQRHAQATTISIRLVGSFRGIGLCVRDDGQGFEVGDWTSSSAGLGLRSMSERSTALGGTFRITSRPSGGTKINVWLPFTLHEAERDLPVVNIEPNR